MLEQHELRKQHLYPNFELADNHSMMLNEPVKMAKLRAVGPPSVASNQNYAQFQRGKRNSLQQKDQYHLTPGEEHLLQKQLKRNVARNNSV